MHRPYDDVRLFSAAMLALVASTASGCEGCRRSDGGGTTTSATIDGAPTNTDPDAAPLNVTPIPTASVAAFVNPDHLPAYTGPTGSVEGTVTVKGEPAADTPADFHKCPDAAKVWGKAFREGPNRALADAIVAVTGYKGFYVPEKDEAETLTIRGCGFVQRTLTMTFGQRIEVKNESNELWTPIIEPGPNRVLRMATPNGDPVKIWPKQPGHYLLGDRDRKYAIADVYVFLHPLHTATDLEGHYRIDGLPVGHVKVNAKHPRIDGETSVDLEVKPALVQKVDLVLENKSAVPKTYDAGTPPPPLH